MNKALKPFWFLLLVLGAVVGFSIIHTSSDAKERIPWRTDFHAATLEAQTANKPLFLYFTATWCGPCQGMKTTTWADADVEKALSAYVPVKIDIDQHPEIVKNYPSDGIPHFVIADGNGKMMREQIGAMGPGDFLSWLNAKAM